MPVTTSARVVLKIARPNDEDGDVPGISEKSRTDPVVDGVDPLTDCSLAWILLPEFALKHTSALMLLIFPTRMYVAAAAVASAATSALAVIALPEMSRILSRGVPALAPWYTHNN